MTDRFVNTLGVRFVDDVVVLQRASNGHVWYLPAYARVVVRLSRTVDWERIVRRLLSRRGRAKVL